MKKKFKLNCEIASTTGEGWFGPTVGPDALELFLGQLGANDKATIEINSPGGDVIAGLEMANMIKNSKAEITAHIVGVAASMASVIACACDKIKMEEASFLMIHNPWTITQGDAQSLRHEAEVLDNMRSAMIAFYRSKFVGVEDSVIENYCNDETWFTSSQAKEAGLDCEIIPCTMRAAACISQIAFAKMPDEAKAFLIKAEEVSTEEAPAEETPAPVEETPAPVEEVSAPVEETPATAEETSVVEETPATAEETPAPVKETPATAEEETPQASQWEARYKGASKKINALTLEIKAIEKKYQNEISEIEKSFNARISELQGDLNKVSTQLSCAEEERDNALKSLDEHVEQIEALKKAHARLAGGVLVPSSKAPRSAADINRDNSLTPAERSKLLASGDYV
jgi:ATP-dependent protease ClpP protease subunit/archaellum component FlaC